MGEGNEVKADIRLLAAAMIALLGIYGCTVSDQSAAQFGSAMGQAAKAYSDHQQYELEKRRMRHEEKLAKYSGQPSGSNVAPAAPRSGYQPSQPYGGYQPRTGYGPPAYPAPTPPRPSGRWVTYKYTVTSAGNRALYNNTGLSTRIRNGVYLDLYHNRNARSPVHYSFGSPKFAVLYPGQARTFNLRRGTRGVTIYVKHYVTR